MSELVELQVDPIEVDLYAPDVASLPRTFPKTLHAGMVDARNSLVEEPEELADLGCNLLEDMDKGSELHLVPTGDLRFVPEEVAHEKLLRLGTAVRTLRNRNLKEGAVT